MNYLDYFLPGGEILEKDRFKRKVTEYNPGGRPERTSEGGFSYILYALKNIFNKYGIKKNNAMDDKSNTINIVNNTTDNMDNLSTSSSLAYNPNSRPRRVIVVNNFYLP